MVRFKSWRDSYLFLKEYGSFTCLQCVGCNHNLDMSKEHSDYEYSHFFCTKQVAMVDFYFQFSCRKWENENGDTISDEDMDKCIFNIPLEVIDAITDDKNGEWSFEEIKELINEYEEVFSKESQ